MSGLSAAERPHNASTYTNHRCRCDECKAAHAMAGRTMRAKRADALAADPSLAPHGTTSTYRNWACRCVECSAAQVESKRRAHASP